MKKTFKNILLIFVFISTGFALGKHYAVKNTQRNADNAKLSLVRVYYMHGTLRCSTCNRIEKMTRKLLTDKYAKETAAGKIEFREENFQENKILAKTFNVLASCVVVAKIEKGKIISHQRLDKVWTLFQNKKQFNAYISKAIQLYLGENK